MNGRHRSKAEVFADLPPLRYEVSPKTVRAAVFQKVDALIVLDDDPTGTQTVYDVPVLTAWQKELLSLELQQGSSLIYILTNSRSMSPSIAAEVNREIGDSIREVAHQLKLRIWVISRSDSTLRGYFPLEIDVLKSSMQINSAICFLVPAFFEGDRYTIGDIHYLIQEEHLLPVGETAFAADKVFGYHSSDLKDWVLEKSDGRISDLHVKSLSLERLRENSIQDISDFLRSLVPEDVCIINACAYSDLWKFCLALLQTEIQPIFRTAASLVAALAGLERRDLLEASDLNLNANTCGALVVVGSFVPLTTQQLSFLQAKPLGMTFIEIDVKILLDQTDHHDYRLQMSKKINDLISSGADVLVYTSRELIAVDDKSKNLSISQTISNFLIEMVVGLDERPRYIMAKGGITSSDLATKGLDVVRATVLGQIIPGVPVWQLGPESRFPGLSYLVFPGNVGAEHSLHEVVVKCRSVSRPQEY